ncbi:unnamed protein product [Discula destructiva]
MDSNSLASRGSTQWRRYFCSLSYCTTTFIFILGIVLIGLSAAAFQDYSASRALARSDNVFVRLVQPLVDGDGVYNLGGHDEVASFADQVRLLERLKARPDMEVLAWWLESTHTADGKWRAGKGLARNGDSVGDEDRLMVSPAANVEHKADEGIHDEQQQQQQQQQHRRGFRTPLPADICNLPTTLPAMIALPTSAATKLPPLPSLPTHVKPLAHPSIDKRPGPSPLHEEFKDQDWDKKMQEMQWTSGFIQVTRRAVETYASASSFATEGRDIEEPTPSSAR